MKNENLILKSKFHLNQLLIYNDKYVIISKHKDNEHYWNSLINLIRVITRANKRT